MSWARKQKVVRYDDGERQVEVTVRQATVLDGIVHDRLVLDAIDRVGEYAEDAYVAAIGLYPIVRAVTVEVDGLPWPCEMADFLELPQELGEAWVQAALELNPQWALDRAEKKTGTVSISG